MRILVKWYFNELLGYLIYGSIPVIDNDKYKPECFFLSSIEMLFYVETTTKRKQNDSIFKLFDFKETVCWSRI